MSKNFDEILSQSLDLEIVDHDTSSFKEIQKLFSTKCEQVARQHVSNNWLLHVSATRENDPKIAVSISQTPSDECQVYKLSCNSLTPLEKFQHSDSVIDIKFCADDRNLLYTATENGVNLWDLRTPQKAVKIYKDTTLNDSSDPKPFTCFDANAQLLVAGTKLHEGDAFILFWDVRSSKLLGGYWESHTDDITQVKLHPNKSELIASGSTDGLVNIYDLTQECEDDALLHTLNSESSIEQLLWHQYNKTKDAIGYLTHTFDLEFWKINDSQAYKTLKRNEIASAIKRKSEMDCYISGLHVYGVDSVLVLAGSGYEGGSCARAFTLNGRNVKEAFSLEGNDQRIESSCYVPEANLLFTIGEKGFLDAWRVG